MKVFVIDVETKFQKIEWERYSILLKIKNYWNFKKKATSQ